MNCKRGVLDALVILSLAACGKKELEPAAAGAPPAVVRGATLAVLAPEPIPELQEAVGTVRARNSALVSARLAGSVTGVYVKEGDRVSRGKLLVAIEAAESGAAAAGAASGVEEAQRGVEEARSRKKLADATL